MREYVLQRLVLTVPTIAAVSVLTFVLLRILPGDIAQSRFAEGVFSSQELVERERARLGLDRPVWEQLGDWLGGIVRLDLGVSMWSGNPVVQEVAIRLPLSLELALMATAIALLVAIPLGLAAARYRDSWLDYAVRFVSIAALAAPSFWVGMLLILALLLAFGWLPPLVFTPIFVDPWKNLSQMLWPALAVSFRYCAVAARMTRSAVLDVLSEDYIRTARAKGVHERRIVFRHALRNAALPVLTVFGLEFAFMMGGLLVTEQVFNLNGVGLLLVQSVSRRDYTMVQALVLLGAVTFILVNLAVDVMYAWLDPRASIRT